MVSAGQSLNSIVTVPVFDTLTNQVVETTLSDVDPGVVYDIWSGSIELKIDGTPQFLNEPYTFNLEVTKTNGEVLEASTLPVEWF